MPYADEEAVVGAAIGALNSNMATVLAAIKAEKGDGVTVPTPRLYYPAEQKEIPELSASSPAVTVAAEEGDAYGLMIGGTRETRLALVIELGCVHSSETTLQIYAYRLSRAIESIIWNKSTNGLGAVGGQVIPPAKRERFQTLTNEAGSFLKITRFKFTVDYTEAF